MSGSGAAPAFRELLAEVAAGVELDRLVRYAELLEQWSAVHSLVRFADRQELVRRHLLEALAAAPLLGERGRLLDVGSGAGLPGVPLLVARPGWRGVLLEPRQKRWAFLKLVIRELGLEAEAVAARYQELGEGEYDAITERALGGGEELLAWAGGRLAPGGSLLLWTTVEDLGRLTAAPGWRVLSFALPASRRGRLAQLRQCFT